MGDVVKASSVKTFGLQGAMEPLVLALGLRMERFAMAHFDAQSASNQTPNMV